MNSDFPVVFVEHAVCSCRRAMKTKLLLALSLPMFAACAEGALDPEPLDPLAFERVTEVDTDATCTDVEVANGFILCVHDGVAVIDPESGAILDRTETEVPLRYGIAAKGARFATGAFGCNACDDGFGFACCPSGQAEPPGVRVYEVGARGELTFLAFFGDRSVDDVAINGDRIYMYDRRLRVFDITSATDPREVGCAEDDGAFGLPIATASDVFVIGDHEIRAYDRGLLELASCATPTLPHAMLDIDLPPMRIAFEKDGALFAVTKAGLSAFDRQLSELGRVEMPGIEHAVLAGDRVFASTESRLLVFDVADPREPRLIGAEERSGIQGIATNGDRVYLVN